MNRGKGTPVMGPTQEHAAEMEAFREGGLSSTREVRRQRIGQSVIGRILFVVYTARKVAHEKETIRIISARQASKKERAAYAGFED